jgi:cyclopropane fatty-acyl-phospholipid synthase-like methyltransferase
MTDRHDQETAASMGATLDIVPYLPELVADMWALGSVPGLVVELLLPLDLPADATRVLDLGCGKGALGITLAKQLGFTVVGVDLCRPFLEEAARRAKDVDVTDRCEFEYCDLRDKLARGGEFDVAVLASLGGVLGPSDQCVGSMRRAVKSGGYIVIDDGFLSHSDAAERPGYQHLTSHEETLLRLTVHGDEVVRERIYSAEETRAINLDYIHHITKRAAGLADRRPDLADALQTYIANQESECDFIDREVTGVIWLLQRA